MDIKEIALKICRGMNPYSDLHESEFIYFANKLIESYKAELLKDVGEPVAKVVSSGAFEVPCLRWTSENASLETLIGTELFTSDQLAAAILKATGPLEEEVEKLSDSAYATSERLNVYIRDNDELRTQLASAQEEIKTVTEQKNRMWFEMQTAQDQLAKAEQRVAEYNELIYAVQTKHHDETRHQTALRYIRNAENRQSYTAVNTASS